MPQCAASPTTPCKATQRGCAALVPRIARRCGSSFSVSSGGTRPPREASASDQWKATRKNAQQAPQRRQGCCIESTRTHPEARSPWILERERPTVRRRAFHDNGEDLAQGSPANVLH